MLIWSRNGFTLAYNRISLTYLLIALRFSSSSTTMLSDTNIRNGHFKYVFDKVFDTICGVCHCVEHPLSNYMRHLLLHALEQCVCVYLCVGAVSNNKLTQFIKNFPVDCIRICISLTFHLSSRPRSNFF